MKYIGIVLFLLVGCSEPLSPPVPEQKIDFREHWNGDKWTGPTLMTPGLPAVPKIFITVPLPDGEEVEEVLFTEDTGGAAPSAVPMTFPEMPAQRPLCGGEAAPAIPKREFKPDESFPQSRLSKPITVTKDGRRYVQVTLYPVKYYPASKKAIPSKGGVLTVKTKKAKAPGRKTAKQHSKAAIEGITEMVGRLPAFESPSRGRVEYLVIGPSDLLSDESGLSELLEEKKARGISTATLSTEDIVSTYHGQDLQEQIRNAVADYHHRYGLRWVLLVGDGFSTTPTKILHLGENPIPSDLYFGCLDGDFGEDSEVDMACEVAVGRAPARSPEEMRTFVEKTLALGRRSSDDPTVWNTLNIGEKMDEETLGYPLLEQLPYPDNAKFGKLYEDFTSGFESDDVVRYMGAYPFYTVNHIGHSNQQYGMRLSSEYIPYVQTSAPFFGFTQGCLSGDLSGPNWASQMVLNEHGGAGAMVANSSYGWYTPGGIYEGASQLLHRTFYEAVFAEGISDLGRALYRAKERLIPHAYESSYVRWALYETNLFGDPELRLNFPRN